MWDLSGRICRLCMCAYFAPKHRPGGTEFEARQVPPSMRQLHLWLINPSDYGNPSGSHFSTGGTFMSLYYHVIIMNTKSVVMTSVNKCLHLRSTRLTVLAFRTISNVSFVCRFIKPLDIPRSLEDISFHQPCIPSLY